jgi:hypothetical protein
MLGTLNTFAINTRAINVVTIGTSATDAITFRQSVCSLFAGGNAITFRQNVIFKSLSGTIDAITFRQDVRYKTVAINAITFRQRVYQP